MRLVVFASLGTLVLVSSSWLLACAAPLDPVGFVPSDSGHHESGSGGDAGTHADSGGHSETGAPDEDSGGGGDSSTSWDTGEPIDTGIDTGRDPFDTGPDDTSDPCTTCVDTSCSSEESACSADPSCMDTISCVSACGDPTCADTCVSTYHSSTFGPFLSCIETTCGPACGGPPPDAGPPPDTGTDTGTDGGVDCSTCIDGHCSTELSACEADADCTALMDCLTTCADPSCASACMSSHPSAKYDALNTCVETNCRTECGGP